MINDGLWSHCRHKSVLIKETWRIKGIG